LFLPRSKTDYDNTGVHIVIAAVDYDAYPLRHMKSILQSDYRDLNAPLLRLTSGASTRKRALAILSRRVKRVGIDTKDLEGHSFRKGAAQEAYNN
jgi:hypothetical protein